jgi:hypothetical protein
MSYGSTKLPLLLERAGVRRIKSSNYIPHIPTFSLWRRSRTCVDIYSLLLEKELFFLNLMAVPLGSAKSLLHQKRQKAFSIKLS